MINCPRCGTAVREEKAFCHNCGSPMDAAKARRETPLPDFGATILEPPRRPAPPPQSFTPPATSEIPTAGRPTAPVKTSAAPPSYMPSGVALHTPANAPPVEGRKRSRRIGFGFVLLLLFLMLLAFVLAIVVD
ncbi:MAG TPA: zinc ribbon domain-containing protein [Pyrinomonadaceae bacterium]|nr:zinc ribbon domain-containing protein [Pyrinomonadaceae bacterium]